MPAVAMTLRLPDALKAEAETYAAGLGISLNALVAVALRDYLDARQRSGNPNAQASGGLLPLADQLPGNPNAQASGGLLPLAGLQKKAPCPCGSGRQWRYCCGKLAR